jgi:hypothetical protein
LASPVGKCYIKRKFGFPGGAELKGKREKEINGKTGQQAGKPIILNRKYT